jgi:molecular chaperone GrpE
MDNNMAHPIEPDDDDNVTPIYGDAGDNEIQKLQSDLQSAKDQLLRALAESENIRRRADKEKEDAAKYGTSNFARDLLNVADNLRRTLDAVKREELDGNPSLKNMILGVEMTERDLLSSMEKHGIKKIAPQIGEPFDYNKHQAMFEIESGEHASGIILQILQPGYAIHDRLLRPALVGVSKQPAPPPAGTAKVDVQA